MKAIYMSPYHRLANLREAMDRALEETLSEKQVSEREMLLAVDVRAEADAFEITAFVPGLEADDLNIEIINNTVAIRGEFKPCAEKDSKYMTCELPAGRFGRVISFPVDIDANQAQANIKNGVLTLRIPKAEAERPKTIKVNAN